MIVRGDCEGAIAAMEKAIQFSQTLQQMLRFRISMIELLHECSLVERAVSEARVLKEYIYAGPQPDIARINRLDALIEKGTADEE